MSEPTPLTSEQEERLGRYRAGRMSEAERAAFEREVVASEALGEELFAEAVLDEVRAERAAVEPLPLRRPRPAVWSYALPVAAALIAVSVLMWSRRPGGEAPDQGGLRGGMEAPRLIEPSGPLSREPLVLRWTSSPLADRYRVELYDDAGNSLGTAVTRDTVVAIAALTARPVAAGEWRVVAILPSGLDGPRLGRAAFRVTPPR